MLAHIDDFALLLTLEQGKPLAEFQAEIRYASSRGSGRFVSTAVAPSAA